MDFKEAVTVLANGECGGIRRKAWHFPEYLSIDCGELRFAPNRRFAWIVEGIVADDWEMVNPKPLTETREVKRWYCPTCGSVFSDPGNVCACNRQCAPLVELSGTYEAPVKRKVKRRVHLGRAAGTGMVSVPGNADIYAEFEE